MFAGWQFAADLTKRADWVATAYRTGVPMGSDLVGPSAGRRPSLAFQALKDPDSANLDRVQVIKVSTLRGKSREQVFDVAWSGNRRIDPRTGKLAATTASGAVELSGVWTDRSFDPAARATYYIRVLEVPTARWSTHWAAAAGVPVPAGRAANVQERAWTSPVWFTPTKARAG